MPRSQHKSIIMNSQDSMSLPGTRHLTAVGPGKCNIIEAKDKNFKIAIISVEGP